MTNLITNINILDNNLLSYGLLGGSLAIMAFSAYYFGHNYLFNSNTLLNDLPSLQDSDTITQNIVNNLKSQPITGSNTVVPKLDSAVESLLHKVDTSVQTQSNVAEANVQTLPNTVDAIVQTSDEALERLLNDILQELLYNNGTPVTSLNETDPEVFADLIRNEPNGPKYLERIQEWSNNVEGISRVSSSNDSQIVFLRNYTEQLKDLVENLELIPLITQQENMKDLQISKFD
jgi:hypothetical protein